MILVEDLQINTSVDFFCHFEINFFYICVTEKLD